MDMLKPIWTFFGFQIKIGHLLMIFIIILKFDNKTTKISLI